MAVLYILNLFVMIWTPFFFLEVLYCHLDMVSILEIFLWLLKQPDTMEGNSELEIYQWFGVMKAMFGQFQLCSCSASVLA